MGSHPSRARTHHALQGCTYIMRIEPWRKAKSWFGYGLRADAKYEIPVAFNVTRASRAGTKELTGTSRSRKRGCCAARTSAPTGGSTAGRRSWRDRYGPLHAPRGKKRTTRTNRSSTTTSTGRGEALVLKPALGAGFEADRGACGTLKHRCPAAAFGCAGRKECCRAAPGWRAVRVDKHDRRLFMPPLGQPLLEAGIAVPPRICSRVDNACGEAPPAYGPRRSSDRLPPLKLAACVQAAARLAPGLRRSAAATGYSPFVLKIERPCGPCGPAGGGGVSAAICRVSAGRRVGKKMAQRKRLLDMRASCMEKMLLIYAASDSASINRLPISSSTECGGKEIRHDSGARAAQARCREATGRADGR